MRFAPRGPLSITLLLLGFALAAAPAGARDLFTRIADLPGRTRMLRAGDAGPAHSLARLAVDEGAIAAFRADGGGTLAVPAPDGSELELQLVPYELFGDGGPTTSDATGRHPFTPDVSLFRGHVAGDDASWAVISMSAEGVVGAVERAGTRWKLSPESARVSGLPMPTHALAIDDGSDEPARPWVCGINESNEAEYAPSRDAPAPQLDRSFRPQATEINSPRAVFKIAVDCDYEYYSVKFGANLTAATAYLMTVLGTVNLIYERDLEVELTFPYVNLWTTSSDPYIVGTTSGALSEVRSYWQTNNGAVDRALVHLVSGRPLGGGIAWIEALCGTPQPGYAVSAIDAVYTYPTNSTTWDVEVIAHELGHNFGSYHTHSCQWSAESYVPSGTTLDTCQASESGCVSASNRLPPDKGTIMSYCHLIAGVAGGIRLEFHPICVSRMRLTIGGAGCLTNPTPAPPRNAIATAIPTGVRLTWTAGGSTGVLRYSVYRSRTQLDLNPTFIGNMTLPGTLQYDDTGLGNWYYRLRTVRTADSSFFSGERKFNVCAFGSPSNTTTASVPAAAVPADFNEDGIVDLAVANNGASTISILLGLGSGAVGNGNFAPAASFATGQQPTCLAADDVNADGILDLVVPNETDNTVVVHLGQGIAGVGDGTINAGTAYTLGFPASGIAIADFDEDGYDDIAVAGAGTGFGLLRGQGLQGLPNGTFAAVTTVAMGASSRGIVVGDFNEDGVWDVATTGSNLRVALGNGTGGHGDGTFATSTSYAVGSTPNHVAIGDYDFDGIADLAVCNTGASTVSILRGQGAAGVGAGTFSTAANMVSGSGPNGVTIGDWNSDGVADLAIASNNSSKVASVLLGRGDATFEAAQVFGASTSPSQLAVSDFNEDGGADLIVVNRAAQNVSRLLAGCVNTLSSTLAVAAPNGGEQWITGTEHGLTWAKGAGVIAVDVQVSRDGGANWITLASRLFDNAWTWTVTGPYTTQARIRVVDSDRPQFADTSNANFTIIPQAMLAVAPGEARFTLAGAAPNPTRRELSVAFSLPDNAAASLELVDLAGRRVATREVGSLGAGTHRIPLLEGQALQPGLYWVRLMRGSERRSLKVAVVR